MTGKRRTRLSVENLEAMSKIHSYYITNSKSELTNYGKDRTTDEICATLNNARRHIEEYEFDDADGRLRYRCGVSRRTGRVAMAQWH